MKEENNMEDKYAKAAQEIIPNCMDIVFEDF